MRDKQFVINSIKMDLYRVVTAAGNLNNPFPKLSINEFMNHAIKDFEKIELSGSEQKLKKSLEDLYNNVDSIRDPLQRLRWAEDVLTIRCLL